MKIEIRRALKTLAIIGAIMLLSACASNTAKTTIIEERATARWETLLSGDIAGAYEYLSPGYRSSVSSQDYQRAILLQRVHWTGAQYKRSECDESTCEVTFLLDFSVIGAVPGVKSYKAKNDIVESWVLVDGMWYLVP